MTTVDRSRIMSAVKAKDTGPERVIRQLLFRNGYRYRVHDATLPGKPDLSFPGRKKVIFVHGCFWHGHTCKRGNRQPVTNKAYWEKKITRNRERDRANVRMLKRLGWSTLVVWECQLKNRGDLLERLEHHLCPLSDGS